MATTPLGTALDVFRLRQYFDVLSRARELAVGLGDDAAFLHELRRAVLPLPFERVAAAPQGPIFPPGSTTPEPAPAAPPASPRHGDRAQRIGVVATGGSGAMACLVGVVRALEERETPPAVLSLCSGSALFGFPLAAGLPADTVGRFVAALRPDEYLDVDWALLATTPVRLGRGFAGFLRGERLEATFRRLLGERTLGELPIPAYAPIWNVETNRLDYLGPRTHPDLPVATALHLAVALPLFFAPVPFAGGHWCDGGLVDIFPVHPVLDIEPPCELVLAVNAFYPPGFAGEDASGWERRRASILHVAGQVRTAEQVQLARENLARLRAATEVRMVEPVPYETVRGTGFYRHFFDPSVWPSFMRAGRTVAARVLAEPAAPAGG